MVLRPILDVEPGAQPGFIPAWSAVERRQTTPAQAWWLIAQADHAAVSGEIARRIGAPEFPILTPAVARAIARHDIGWAALEPVSPAPPQLHRDGRPLAFFEIAPDRFLQAWRQSIESAAQDSAAGGYMVSQHFAALGEYRLRRDEDPPEIRTQLTAFVEGERARQKTLRRGTGGDWDSYLPVLQFCDLLSLYLCSGTQQPVEFSYPFGHLRAHYEGDTACLEPTPLRGQAELLVAARRYPAAGASETQIRLAVR